MTKKEDPFFTDPWEYITQPIYPKVNRLFTEDDRFYVSINEEDQKLFIIQVPQIIDVDIVSELNSVEIKVVGFDQDKTRLLCILTDKDLIDSFTLVIKDVAHRCKEYSDELVINKSIERLLDWSEFLKPSRKGIKKSEQRGLWGEMFVLREYMSEVHPIEDAVKFWVGQDKSKQDFTLNHIALEVKTSMSGATPVIKISSIDQLEKVTDYLYLMKIFINEGNDPDAKSLKDLYENIIESIGDDRETLTKFLSDTSRVYDRATEKQINEKFIFLNYELYEIVEKFPRLSKNDFSEAIIIKDYELDRSKIAEFLIEEPVENLIKND